MTRKPKTVTVVAQPEQNIADLLHPPAGELSIKVGPTVVVVQTDGTRSAYDLAAEAVAKVNAATAPVPSPAPRLRTYSDEVSELRGALIAMLWNVVGGDTDESCGGDCEARGDHGDGTPFPACAAVRALGWSDHFDAKAFEMRASR